MEIDLRFPTKLDAIADAPEPLRSTLVETVPANEPVRLLLHAPAFSTAAVQSPATLLAVTTNGWFLASESEQNGASVEKCRFADTLFLELTSVLLLGQLKIYFAAVGTAYSATIQFNTIGEDYYREAAGLILAGIDPVLAKGDPEVRDGASLLEGWPLKIRDEAQRYRPKGQRLRAAIRWPAIMGGFQRELAPAGALLITDREFVFLSEEKRSPRQLKEGFYEFGGIITFFPRVRVTDFHVSDHGRFGVLALQVHSALGGEKLEIVFPADEERTLSKAIESVLVAGEPTTES